VNNDPEKTQFRRLGALVILLSLAATALVAAQSRKADPRELSPTDKTSALTTTSALLTGDGVRLQGAVAAGAATAEIRLTPVAFHPGGFYGQGDYYSYQDITGQRLTVSGGGGRTFWNMQLSNWGPSGSLLWAYQGQILSGGLLGANADCSSGPGSCGPVGNLTLANSPCVTDLDCAGELGEQGAICNAVTATCDAAFVNMNRSDFVFSTAPPEFIVAGCIVADPAGVLCFGTPNVNNSNDARVDEPGVQFYGATIVIDVATDAKGLYTLDWDPIQTFLGEDAQPLPRTIPLAAAVPGELNILVGSCCTHVGLSTLTCMDTTTQSECEITSNAPFIWRRGQICAKGCFDCEANSHCDIGNACTIDTCVGFVCRHDPIDTWDPQTQCCNPNTAEVTDIPPHNFCIEAACTSGGQPVLTARPIGLPCTLGDTCIPNPKCSGDGQCLGTPDLGSACPKPRFISFTPADFGFETEIYVIFNSLHRPSPPYAPGIETKDFSNFEGQFRWVGQPFDCVDSPALGTTLKCAMLTCTPTLVDWTAAIGDQPLHITGDAIVPSSSYDIEQWFDPPASTIPVKVARGVRTARWGDVGDPHQDPLSSARNQPDVTDIIFTVDKVKDSAGALSKPRVYLRGNIPDPTLSVNTTDIVLTVDALKGLGFPFSGPSPCGP